MYVFAEQLQEIRKVKLSRVLCDNTDLLDTVQIYAMILPDHEMYVLPRLLFVAIPYSSCSMNREMKILSTHLLNNTIELLRHNTSI